MKGCFLLQRTFAYLGHDIARHLKERYGVTEFCAYVQQRSSYDFLRSQTDIPYSTLLLDEELRKQLPNEKLDTAYLETLEKTYGIPFLWPMLAVDRVIMSSQLVREYPFNEPMYTHEEMLRIIQIHARAIIEMLDREKPDFLFCSVVGNVGAKLLWHIAKARGIKTHMVLMTGTRDRYVVSEEADRFTTTNQLFRSDAARLRTSPAWKIAESYLEKFRATPSSYYERSSPTKQPVTRKKQFAFLAPNHAIRSVATWIKVIQNYYTSSGRFDYSTLNPWIALWDLLKRKTRNLIGMNDLYDSFDPTEAYAFFPLHFEPEVSLLLLAPTVTDQITLIRNVARSLPVQFKLVVKEHPEMAQYRPRAFYRELKKIPNLKLLPPSMPSFEITRNAKLITTITGTIGWEAVMMGKPVISFGHWFYNDLSSVTYCDTIEKLPALIQEKLTTVTPNHDETQTFLAALFEDSAELNFHHIWIEETDPVKRFEGLRPLADLLAKKLGLTAQKTP